MRRRVRSRPALARALTSRAETAGRPGNGRPPPADASGTLAAAAISNRVSAAVESRASCAVGSISSAGVAPARAASVSRRETPRSYFESRHSSPTATASAPLFSASSRVWNSVAASGARTNTKRERSSPWATRPGPNGTPPWKSRNPRPPAARRAAHRHKARRQLSAKPKAAAASAGAAGAISCSASPARPPPSRRSSSRVSESRPARDADGRSRSARRRAANAKSVRPCRSPTSAPAPLVLYLF